MHQFQTTDTNEVFSGGKLTVSLDAQAGSSGKGVIGSFVTAHANNYQFVCNTFTPQAGHWVKLDGGESHFYQTFNSCAYQDQYEKMYIGHGGIIELPAFFRELEENNIKPHRVGISPIVAVLQDKDAAFERGEVAFDGMPKSSDGTMKYGSTCHGVGACKARKILRRPDMVLARDAPELQEFLCDVPGEIMARLDSGQAGLLEIAQGFQLSYGLDGMYPYCTSRNCTVSAAFDDMMLPVKYAGNVILNLRTYPIRINNKKYVAPDGRHLSWDEVQSGVEHTVKVYNSGPGYEDQKEIDWDTLTRESGSKTPIMECTSVTKLPRRVFTFSKDNLRQAIKFNDTGNTVYLSVNFVNYVDAEIFGVRGANWDSLKSQYPKVTNWIADNIEDICGDTGAVLKFLGTGPLTDDTILC